MTVLGILLGAALLSLPELIALLRRLNPGVASDASVERSHETARDDSASQTLRARAAVTWAVCALCVLLLGVFLVQAQWGGGEVLYRADVVSRQAAKRAINDLAAISDDVRTGHPDPNCCAHIKEAYEHYGHIEEWNESRVDATTLLKGTVDLNCVPSGCREPDRGDRPRIGVEIGRSKAGRGLPLQVFDAVTGEQLFEALRGKGHWTARPEQAGADGEVRVVTVWLDGKNVHAGRFEIRFEYRMPTEPRPLGVMYFDPADYGQEELPLLHATSRWPYPIGDWSQVLVLPSAGNPAGDLEIKDSERAAGLQIRSHGNEATVETVTPLRRPVVAYFEVLRNSSESNGSLVARIMKRVWPSDR